MGIHNHHHHRSSSAHRFRVSVDLTRANYQLLTAAREKCDNNNLVSFVYADCNCNLGLRTSAGQMKMFRSSIELDNILTELA